MAVSDLTNTTWNIKKPSEMVYVQLSTTSNIDISLSCTITCDSYSVTITNGTVRFRSYTSGDVEINNFYVNNGQYPMIRIRTNGSPPNTVWYIASASQSDAYELGDVPCTLTITGGTGATNTDLIAWLEANATQVDLTNTTWLFDDSIDFTQSEISATYSVDFTMDYNGYTFSFDTLKYSITHYVESELAEDYWRFIIRYESTEEPGLNTNAYTHTIGTLNTDRWVASEFKTITITGGTDVTNATLIAWLEANATQQTATAGVEVTYNGSTIKTLTENGSFTLSCNGKKMASDVVISATDVQAITATYNGNTIINGSGTNEYTLSTNGKYMATDIVVNVTVTAPSTYSGNILSYQVSYGGTETYIKFDSAPSSYNDYDSYADIYGEVHGLTNYSDKTKVYVWGGNRPKIKINNVEFDGGAYDYTLATEVTLTGNYDIYLGYSFGSG